VALRVRARLKRMGRGDGGPHVGARCPGVAYEPPAIRPLRSTTLVARRLRCLGVGRCCGEVWASILRMWGYGRSELREALRPLRGESSRRATGARAQLAAVCVACCGALVRSVVRALPCFRLERLLHSATRAPL